ncbi:hypothetical protein [Nostoc sp.]|uniref:hypothetical protein n=1 Tax=Nostoc sp. TaxID=1180 RepID=UPI002FFC0659
MAWEPPFGFGGDAPSPKGRRYANVANATLTQSPGTAKTATPSPQRAGSLIASLQWSLVIDKAQITQHK